jgi:hypothetical protein
LILTVDGKPVAVLLPVWDADVETVSLSFNPKFLAIMEESRRSFDREGGISSEEIRKHFGLPPTAGQDANPMKMKSTANSRARKNGGRA